MCICKFLSWTEHVKSVVDAHIGKNIYACPTVVISNFNSAELWVHVHVFNVRHFLWVGSLRARKRNTLASEEKVMHDCTRHHMSCLPFYHLKISET